MGMTRIYGCSDNLVEIEGKKRKEIHCFGSNVRIWFTDGTVALMGYPKKKLPVWWIKIEETGTATHSLKRCRDANAEPYSDILRINAGVRRYEVVDRKAPQTTSGAPMTLDDYQQLAQRTFATTVRHDMIAEACMGLCGESGECIDLLKKWLYQGHNIERARMGEELGDVLWYVAELASGRGYTLGGIAAANIDKLRERYPDGFDPERSLHRTE